MTGIATATYKVVLPQLPTGNAVRSTVFSACGPQGSRRIDPDLDLREIPNEPHLYTSYESSSSEHKLFNKAEFFVKGLKCAVCDPETENIKVKPL